MQDVHLRVCRERRAHGGAGLPVVFTLQVQPECVGVKVSSGQGLPMGLPAPCTGGSRVAVSAVWLGKWRASYGRP